MPPSARPAVTEVAEFTAKAVVAGIVLGLVFGAANAYLGLRVGLTVSASIPAAVMTVALFRLFGRRGLLVASAAGVAAVRLVVQLVPDAVARWRGKP